MIAVHPRAPRPPPAARSSGPLAPSSAASARPSAASPIRPRARQASPVAFSAGPRSPSRPRPAARMPRVDRVAGLPGRHQSPGTATTCRHHQSHLVATNGTYGDRPGTAWPRGRGGPPANQRRRHAPASGSSPDGTSLAHGSIGSQRRPDAAHPPALAVAGAPLGWPGGTISLTVFPAVSVGLSGREAVAEGDDERVECGLPAHRPSGPAGPGRLQRPGYEIQAL